MRKTGKKFRDIKFKSEKLKEGYPTYAAFYMYYFRHRRDDQQKSISREGLGNYLRNERPLLGCAMAYRTKIGSYEIDETPADVHEVSEFDRSKTIGRPNVYLAVDAASQLITGVYVGMDAGDEALLSCLANAVQDKVSFCKSFGIEISDEDWPCKGMPSEIICDRGGEFTGSRMDEICMRYGVDININAPFRPDLKSVVERNIDLIQDCYTSSVAGKGGIESDFAERWAIDYRKQAVLTLNEYREIVINCILAINSRVLEETGSLPMGAPDTPIALWKWLSAKGKNTLLKVDETDVYRRALPRTTAKFERSGVHFNNLRYVPGEEYRMKFGEKVTFNKLEIVDLMGG